MPESVRERGNTHSDVDGTELFPWRKALRPYLDQCCSEESSRGAISYMCTSECLYLSVRFSAQVLVFNVFGHDVYNHVTNLRLRNVK